MKKKTKICSNCKNEIEINSIFCNFCGVEQKEKISETKEDISDKNINKENVTLKFDKNTKTDDKKRNNHVTTIGIISSIILMILSMIYFLTKTDTKYLMIYGGKEEFIYWILNITIVSFPSICMLLIIIVLSKILYKLDIFKKIMNIIICICIIINIVIFYFQIKPNVDYNIAQQYLKNINNGKTINDTEYEEISKYLSLNKNYKDNAENLNKLKYLKAQKLYQQKDYDTAISLLNSIQNYNNAKELINNYSKERNEKIYNTAITLYNEGKFIESKNNFKKLSEDYNEALTYLTNIERLISIQGTWKEYKSVLDGGKEYFPTERLADYIYINGWVLYINVGESFERSYTFTINNNIISFQGTKLDTGYWINDYIFNDENTEMYHPYMDQGTGAYYIHISKDRDLSQKELATPKEPYIGMTEEEVLKSTWGAPIDKNRTRTKYGAHEQWIYGNGRYIYLDDGIVTSIQD